MKRETEIQNACDRIRPVGTAFPGMTYEEGIRIALEWVLGVVEDEDLFEEGSFDEGE